MRPVLRFVFLQLGAGFAAWSLYQAATGTWRVVAAVVFLVIKVLLVLELWGGLKGRKARGVTAAGPSPRD